MLQALTNMSHRLTRPEKDATRIAFLVYPSNEDECVKLISSNAPIFMQMKLLATKTPSNKIESVIDRRHIVYYEQITSPAELGKILKAMPKALFYLTPSNPAFLLDIISRCAAKHVYIALTWDTADCVIQRLVSEQGIDAITEPLGGTPGRRDALTWAGTQGPATLRLRTNSDAFIVAGPLAILKVPPKTAAENRRTEWSQQQLMFWLESNQLEYLREIYLDLPPTSANAEASQLWMRDNSRNNYLKIKAGTPAQLVNLLTLGKSQPLHEVFDYALFVRDFFLTFHSFCSPNDLLSLLETRFVAVFEESDEDEAMETTEAIAHVLSIWTTFDGSSDFVNNNELYKGMADFAVNMVKDRLEDPRSITTVITTLDANIAKRLQTPQKDYQLGSSRDYGLLRSILQTPSEDIAQAMTMMESSLYQRLRSSEFHRSAWSRRNAHELCPNLIRLIELSNHISNLIVTSTLRTRTDELAADAIVKWIKVGRLLCSMHNYSGVMAVATALNNPAITRLKPSWAMLSVRNKEILEQLSDLVTPIGHYKNYRRAFNRRPPKHPALPILPTALSELNSYEEVYSSTTSEGAVNWSKMMGVSDVIWNIVSLNTAYRYHPHESLQNQIATAPVWSDNFTTCAIATLRLSAMSGDPEGISSGGGTTTSAGAQAGITSGGPSAAGGSASRPSSVNRRPSRIRHALIPQSRAGSHDAAGSAQDLTTLDWKMLMINGQVATYKPGEEILPIGAPNDKLYRIHSGTVRVVKEVGGQTAVVATMTKQDVFGEVSMLLRSQKEGTTTAAIVAETETVVWIMSVHVVLDLCRSTPLLSEKLNRILALKLAKRLRGLNKPSAAPTPATAAASPPTKPVGGSPPPSGAIISKMKPPPTAQDYEAVINRRFNKRFGLANETLFYEIECDLKISRTVNGTMYISNNYVCFDGNVFGYRVREVIPVLSIMDVRKKKKYIAITRALDVAERANKQPELLFGNFLDRNIALHLLTKIWSAAQNSSAEAAAEAAAIAAAATAAKAPEKEGASPKQAHVVIDDLLPSPEDWDLILKGARVSTFKRDDVVLLAGDRANRLYQLTRGEIRFEKTVTHAETGTQDTIVLGRLTLDGHDSIFGEISFLEGGEASVSVIADRDDTQVAIIEHYWLQVLFEYYPVLAGRWYHYLAHVLSRRLKQREEGGSVSADSEATKPSTKQAPAAAASGGNHAKQLKT